MLTFKDSSRKDRNTVVQVSNSYVGDMHFSLSGIHLASSEILSLSYVIASSATQLEDGGSPLGPHHRWELSITVGTGIRTPSALSQRRASKGNDLPRRHSGNAHDSSGVSVSESTPPTAQIRNQWIVWTWLPGGEIEIRSSTQPNTVSSSQQPNAVHPATQRSYPATQLQPATQPSPIPSPTPF